MCECHGFATISQKMTITHASAGTPEPEPEAGVTRVLRVERLAQSLRDAGQITHSKLKSDHRYPAETGDAEQLNRIQQPSAGEWIQ